MWASHCVEIDREGRGPGNEFYDAELAESPRRKKTAESRRIASCSKKSVVRF